MNRPIHHRTERPRDPVDSSFLAKGFYDNDVMRTDLIEKYPRELAIRFGPRGGFDKVSSAQLRRFFSDVRELESRLKGEGVDLDSKEDPGFIKHLPSIKMFKSKLAYAMGRGVVSKSFQQVLSSAIDQIKTPRDFKAFVLFFESIVGYYYGEGGGR